MSSLSLKLPNQLDNKLKKLSRKIKKSESAIMIIALDEYLQDYEDYLDASTRLRDKSDEILSLKEFRQKFNV